MQKCGRGFLYPCLKFKRLHYIEARTRNDEQTDMIIGVKEVVLGEKLLIEAVV
ncbi:hypothetical protein ACIF0M_06120 [Dorea amylophila]|uniref:Uncharacterized protein n=1 Tax=Dorea amylophila TaxID=2981789 RepID=A0ABW8AXK3_9FIRM